VGTLQSSSFSPAPTAAQAGFFILSESGERPERWREILRFDTMPSQTERAAMVNKSAVK
jgi:hypothetical protein